MRFKGSPHVLRLIKGRAACPQAVAEVASGTMAALGSVIAKDAPDTLAILLADKIDADFFCF